jgi:hypothetical protein
MSMWCRRVTGMILVDSRADRQLDVFRDALSHIMLPARCWAITASPISAA